MVIEHTQVARTTKILTINDGLIMTFLAQKMSLLTSDVQIVTFSKWQQLHRVEFELMSFE
jgi:hypothetical protein